MVALQLCVTVTESGNGSKGYRKSYKEQKYRSYVGRGAAWKHREETALRPDSVTKNKDNLFPSNSITVHCTAHKKTVLVDITP